MLRSRPAVAVIGAGPAGLMAAEVAAAGGADVTVFEAMPSAARKLLMAGRGGLNLTHSEPFDRFTARYRIAAPHLRPALEAFGPAALRAWSEALGAPTFVGSSGRVFPVGLKTSPLLRAWLGRLAAAGVALRPRHRWMGWDAAGALCLATPAGPLALRPAATILALGGASWPRLGADGGWATLLAPRGVALAPFAPSNGGMIADWSPVMGERFAGQPLKSIALRLGALAVRGEAMVTARGLEGGAVYALSADIRAAIAREGEAVVHIDLRPDLDTDALAARLAAQPAKASLSTALRKGLALAPVAIALVQEARHRHGAEAAAPRELAALVKAVPVRLLATAPLAEAISTAGGVSFDAVTADFMLRALPGVFAAGEMLDWEAPTGGYLLQACFATGAAAARGALAWIGDGDQSSR